MDRQLEKRLSDRAVAIGREGEVKAFGELLELLRSSSANARRLSASALGKLAWMGVDQAAAVAALAPVARPAPADPAICPIESDLSACVLRPLF